MSYKTLDDLVNECDPGQSQVTKTASTTDVGQAKTASSEGVNPMGLMELYEQNFSQPAAPSVKTASAAPAHEAPAVMQKTAEEIRLTKLGSAAREAFDAHVDNFLFKFAMEDIASREADASVPGVGDPQLPVNRPADAAAPVNTTPVYADETDRARMVAKEELINTVTNIQNAITQGGAVDLGAEMPAAQLG